MMWELQNNQKILVVDLKILKTYFSQKKIVTTIYKEAKDLL